ncbi:MAG: Holliday junction ATP-dependent DNA helicase RuvB [Candidatus Magasanikbacteria bacterium GW2011_GWA2_45_39]|uniref:Holliday junction branch migration complex subunit RuvB n=1 Tax=Candidatus Magasanikbacteria bacterium GW2011_GWA2_45_39 TaxID=1619041 RepID=A0A0G1PNQ9_9BACT|nr:MAG: Holliday junction ATP-dependent DNA helicase RuvB [Candidatus Magasanikbacteria bacterium GW2011_GWA2_45_39]
MEERIIDPALKTDEHTLDTTLRPSSLNEFIGQEKIKNNLGIFLAAAQKRKETLEHVLLYGNPGLGKTTLAYIIAKEMGGSIKITSGPALERVGDIASILTSLEKGDILFIDEIHRINKNIEEVLYPAMEESALDVIIGKGPGARSIRIDLNNFTLIGATTKISLLSAPLRDRFGATYHLAFYEDHEIEKIIKRSARILNVSIHDEATHALAARARRTPRVANRLLKRVRDFAEVTADGIISSNTARDAFKLLEVDGLGLDHVDRVLLQTLIEKFNGGPVGLSALAAATAEETETIEQIYEPFLMQLGFIDRTQRGRIATPSAYAHLGKQPPANTRSLFNSSL